MPIFQLGPENLLGQLTEGARAAIPPNAIMFSLQLGKIASSTSRWLNIGYKSILGQKIELGEEFALPTIIAPASNGGSALAHVPVGTIVSALQLGNASLTVSYRQIISPTAFQLGDEIQGVGKLENTKEPHTEGGGDQARKDGYTMTGFQWKRDPDEDLTLLIWYRQLP